MDRASSRFGDKAGWLKKKLPGRDWETQFCMVKHGRLEYYEDEGMTILRGSFDLKGAKLDYKVPSHLIEGSQDVHHGTDKFSFMAEPRGQNLKKQQRHIFKAANNEEKYEWFAFLHYTTGARRRAPAEESPQAGPAVLAGSDEFDVEEVMSKLEIYASLVSFRVQRKFIHILRSPRFRDAANLKTLVTAMIGMGRARVSERTSTTLS